MCACGSVKGHLLTIFKARCARINQTRCDCDEMSMIIIINVLMKIEMDHSHETLFRSIFVMK